MGTVDSIGNRLGDHLEKLEDRADNLALSVRTKLNIKRDTIAGGTIEVLSGMAVAVPFAGKFLLWAHGISTLK
ncbi:MAG: hypothetical protein B7X02_00055 [Rhodospirillales bacterium 12-54-5]|nr:MAG: hypothetical protein B7X02_00055 [Rhodospirillales bacterium 12-54-5]